MNAASVAHGSEQAVRDIGLIIILPDAIRQGLVQDIGTHLGRIGLYVVAAIPVMLTKEHYTALYPNGPAAKTSANGRMHGPAMTTRLWGLDNSLAVLVGGPEFRAAEDRDLSTVLHDCKGPSSFLQRRTGSLRDLSALADRCMSLVHTPDDWDDAVRDITLFYPDLDHARLTACRGERRIDWQVVELSRAWHAYGPGDSRYGMGVRTALRCIATQLAAPGRRGILRQDELWLMYDSCVEWLAQEPCAPQCEHARYLDLCAILRCSLSRHLPHPSSRRFEAISDLLDLMTKPEAFNHQAGLRALAILHNARFAISDFERHLLLTLMTFLNDSPQ